jgi:transcriptional regulator with PAS, ATPase and Fis domain
VIAATNRDLETLTGNGAFRDDLFYRLNVLAIRIPPLRERKEDIEPLALHFLNHTRVTLTVPKRFKPETLKRLEAYAWPGNIRELANVVERAVILAGNAELITPEHLPPEIRQTRPGRTSAKDAVQSMEAAEKDAIVRALAAADGNKSKTAKLLGISRPTLHHKLKLYNIQE